jgi:hypothetical protein
MRSTSSSVTWSPVRVAARQAYRRADLLGIAARPRSPGGCRRRPRHAVVGAEHGREFWRVMAHGEMALDIAAARQDILAAGDEVVAKDPDSPARGAT